MSCDKQTDSKVSDRVEAESGKRLFDASTTAWLIGQGIHFLNTADKEGELAYRRIVEIIRNCSKDTLKTIASLYDQVASGDAPLRWSLLYVLGDTGDETAANFLVKTAIRQLPEANPNEGCEGTRDTEMLVSTMAVHALKAIVKRHPQASDHILQIISEKPIQPILVEAVKAAGELGLEEKARELLGKENQWILDIRQAHKEELIADPERADGKERGFTPPKMGSQYTAPQTCVCKRKEE